MKIFHCSHCQHLVFFENTQCVHCGRQLAYSPGKGEMLAVDPEAQSDGLGETSVRLCQNYVEQGICNWAVDAEDDDPLCLSCRLTRVIPPLQHVQSVGLWQRAETAKRRLVVNLLALGLPVRDSTLGANDGIHFEFKEPQAGQVVLTGHHEGTITLNLLEADDVLRERLRAHFAEPYRTVLGHLRHESGHYYWERLVKNSARHGDFQGLFGDESADYRLALEQHYRVGPREDWAEGYISAYASSHPWEDWAETWAHYLHMTDTLETAQGCGLSLTPDREDEPLFRPDELGQVMQSPFETLISSWFPVTYLLNNLSRGLGLADAYPFVLNSTVIAKLRFVHDTIAAARSSGSQDPAREAA